MIVSASAIPEASANHHNEAVISTTYPRFSARIACPAGTLFALLADLPNHIRWLSNSRAFGGVMDVSPYPVKLGTTYLDYGPAGARPGVVTEFEPPSSLGLHQTMQLKGGFVAAHVDIRIRYVLTPESDAVLLTRDLVLTIRTSGWRRVLLPVLRRRFRLENQRMMNELKHYAEKL